MQSLSVYLNFAGNAKEAFEYYRSVFGGEFDGVLRFRDMGEDAMGASGADLDKIAHISLPIAEGVSLMASDVIGEQVDAFNPGNNAYVYLEAGTAEEAERVFAALADGGVVEMPLEPSQWAEKYGVCVDRFDVGWMLSYTGDVEFEL